MVCSEDYDTHLFIQHTHQSGFSLEFKREVEPGIIKIFDLNISNGNDDLNVRKLKQNEVRLISLRDDEFVLDQAKYKDELINQF